MSGRIVLNPTQSLVETVASRLEAKGRDYSTVAVVFPGKRPAHYLRKELAARAGGSIIPPKIFSVDEFILMLYQHLHPEKVHELESMDAVALLHLVHKEIQDRLGGEFFTSLDAFIPIGLKLFGELEELRLAALPERRVREELSKLTFNRLYSLPEYYSKFYAVVRQKGYVTRAVRYAEVAEHMADCDLREYSQVVVAELFKKTPVEQTIFDALEQRANTLFIYQTPILEAGLPEPEIHFYKASDTHGQVFALSALLKKQLDAHRQMDERSAIILPTAEALFPVVHQTLSLMQQEEYNIALEYPVARTPIFGFLNSLMELICSRQGNRYSAEKYIKFILHPYTKNIRIGQRADITRVLFHAIESKLTDDASNILIMLEELEQDDELFTRVAYALSEENREVQAAEVKDHLHTIHTRTVYMLEHITSIREFAQRIIEVLTYIYEQSTARLHPLFHQYAEALLKIFLHLEQSFAGGEALNDASGYLTFLHQYIALQRVPFSGTPLKGLQVLGLLETRNLRFDDVYFLNVNEEVLPGGIGNQMLLPQKLRQQLGLETRQDREQLSDYYFQLLIRGAKRVHLFFAESGESEKSRFIEQLLWERQKRDGTSSADPYVRTIRYHVKLAHDAVPPIFKSEALLARMRGFTYSSSALDTYLQCPIKFYYQEVLRVKEKEEASADLDNTEIGKFIHDILHEFFRPCIGRILERNDLQPERMHRLIDEWFTRKFGTEPAGTFFLLKRQVHRQLASLLLDYQQPIAAETPIILQGLEQSISVRALETKFKGRLDRMEQRKDKIFIIDYKTGPPANKPPISFGKLRLEERESWNKAVTSLQLPIYLLLYSIQTKTPIEQIVPANLYLGKNGLGIDCEVAFAEDGQERTMYFDQIKKLLALLIQEINNASIPFSPPVDLSDACPKCPYTVLCGTAWVKGWKA